MDEAKIVVVDDHEAVLKTLRQVLSRVFKTVVCVSNPALLPALLHAGDIDVVLLDMNFGTGKHSGGEGLFWLGRIRECPGPPAVVLMTAFGDIALAVDSLKRGAADFVVKPWDNDKLVETVRSACRQRRRQFFSAESLLPHERRRTEDRKTLDRGGVPFTTEGTDRITVSDKEKCSERVAAERSDGGADARVDKRVDGRTEEQTLSRLLDSLLEKYAEAYGKPLPRLTAAAFDKLVRMVGRGDLALLQQTVERAVLLTDRSLLDAGDFRPTEEDRKAAFDTDAPIAGGGSRLHGQTLEEMEKDFIAEVLKQKNGNLTSTAQQLNISRQTLYNKMRKYNL